MQDHRIVEVKVLKNRETKHAKRAEDVVERVLQAQSLQADASTGATTTSKALLKAMENALAKIPSNRP